MVASGLLSDVIGRVFRRSSRDLDQTGWCLLLLSGLESHFTSRSAMAEIDYAACAVAAELAARAAGEEIKAAWDAERDVEYKGTVDLVTATDKKCEDLIFDMLQQVPDARVRRGGICRGGGRQAPRDRRWTHVVR